MTEWSECHANAIPICVSPHGATHQDRCCHRSCIDYPMTFKGTYYSFKAEDHYVRGATTAGVARVGRHLPQLEVRVWFFRPIAAPTWMILRTICPWLVGSLMGRNVRISAGSQVADRPIADIPQTDSSVASSRSEGDPAQMFRVTKDRFRVSKKLAETSAQLASLKTNSFRRSLCPSRETMVIPLAQTMARCDLRFVSSRLIGAAAVQTSLRLAFSPMLGWPGSRAEAPGRSTGRGLRPLRCGAS